MNLQLRRIAATLLVALTLSACSMFSPPDAQRLLFGLLPTNELGYEVSTSGEITITARTLQLSAKPGMPVTTVFGYRVEFFDETGALVGETSDVPQTLNVTVPAGFICDTPDPVLGCNAFSVGARPANGVPASVAGIQDQFLNGDIAVLHQLAGFPTGWYADITLFYYNSLGEFEETYRFDIVTPN